MMNYKYENYSRRICWPDPDVVCLEGGCIYCNYNEWVKVSDIWHFVDGHVPLMRSFEYGAERNFCNADFRDDTTGELIR